MYHAEKSIINHQCYTPEMLASSQCWRGREGPLFAADARRLLSTVPFHWYDLPASGMPPQRVGNLPPVSRKVANSISEVEVR